MSPPTRNDLGLDMNNGLATVVFLAFFAGTAATVFLGGYHNTIDDIDNRSYSYINQSYMPPQ